MKKLYFDSLLKEKIALPEKFGYCTANYSCSIDESDSHLRCYDLYYNNVEFEKFCNEMKGNYPEIFKAYNKGKGSELVGNPPKMASVASSSRFCYLALRNATIKDFGENCDCLRTFDFEKDLEVDEIKGTNPQMDAFLSVDETAYFFEFKCHEIFDVHNKKISGQYGKFFKNRGMEIDLDKKQLYDSDFITGLNTDDIVLFDSKQFITHLSGIVSYEQNKGMRKIFSYVYFKPLEVFDDLYSRLTEEVKNVFASSSVKRICNDYNIELRLYYYENDIMDGFEKEIKPRRQL